MITVDGVLIDSSYVNKTDDRPMISHGYAAPDSDGIWEDTVPEGMIFVLGDNRQVSKDSRSLGYMDTRYVLGKVKCRLLPLNKITFF